MGWIDAEQVLRNAEPIKKNGYGQYLITHGAGVVMCNENFNYKEIQVHISVGKG